MLIVFELGFAFSSLMFASVPGYELLLQISSIAAVAVAAATGVLTGRFQVSRIAPFEVASYSAAMASLLVGVFSNNEYVTQYSVLFIVTLFSASLVARSVSFSQLIHSISIAYYVSITFILLFQGNELALSLAGNPITRWENRFSPLSIHPNLAGLIYSGGIIILACRYLRAARSERILILVSMVICVLIDLAASARGSLLALLITGSIFLAVHAEVMRQYFGQLAVGLIILAFVVFAVFPDQLEGYLSTMLELNSNTRGIDSGGSGRLDLWRQGIELLVSRNLDLLYGSGLRSSSIEQIGFSTESSYITIFLESGLIFGGAQIAAIVAQAFARKYAVPQEYRSWTRALIVFFLIQSTFNRYLVAIGNPFSLSFLLILIVLGSAPATQRLRPFRPHQPIST